MLAVSRLFRVLAVVAWGWGQCAMAQLDVSWKLAQNRTVLMEPVRATIKIANRTGRDLDLSPDGNAQLRFDVEDRPTSLVATTGQPLIRQTMVIGNGDEREIEVNLLDAYRIIKGQSYTLTPMVEYGGMRFFGQRLSLEVQPGLELLKREYGMPTLGDARTVTLRLIHRERSDRLFFRIDDPGSGYCLGVYELGRIIRYFSPTMEQDRNGNFHVLHQDGPDRFSHSIFDYDGGPKGKSYFSGEAGKMRLERDSSGNISVAGGIRYEEDPAQPGMLIAPALAPAHPYATTIGELPAKGRRAQDAEKTIGW